MFFFIFTGYLVACTLYASVFEWWLHKNVMHKRFPGLEKFEHSHQHRHHDVMDGYDGYHLPESRSDDRHLVKMKWWHGIALVLISSSPMLIVWIVSGVWWPFAGLAGVLSVYFGLYETIHWCMHLPQSKLRIILKVPLLNKVFSFLDRHHRIHHRKYGKNLNVVFPAMDWFMGTLVTEIVEPAKASTNQQRSSLPLDPTLDK